MLVWSEFCQEMFACLAECKPAVWPSAAPASGITLGEGAEPLWGGKVLGRTGGTAPAPAVHAARGPQGCAGRWCLFSLGCSNCGEGRECHLLSELEQPGSWLAVGGASRRIPGFSPLFTESQNAISACHCVPHYTWIAMADLQVQTFSTRILLFPNMLFVPQSSDGSSCCLCCCGGPWEAVKLLSLLDNTGAASFSSWLSGTELMLCAPPLHMLSAAHVPLGPGRARCSHPSLGDSFTASASQFYMMSLNIIKQKGPTSWSWTES